MMDAEWQSGERRGGIKIARAEVYAVSVPRKEPFKVAYASRTAARSILLRLSSGDGREGWGEAVPIREVTGEAFGDVWQALRRVAAESLPGLEAADRDAVRARFAGELGRFPSARCAATSALLDLYGRTAGLPAARILGGARARVRASVTIGVLDLPATVAAAKARLSEGFRDIKLKVGLDAPGDAERVKAVRREGGPGFRLFLDANQGFSPADALRFLRAVSGEGVEFCEQPVAASDLDALARVSAESPIPVMADEAVTSPAGLARLLDLKAAPLVNIKLQKCGGPFEAFAMAMMAESCGVGAMIGCMTETRVGISAGLAVALAASGARYVDLDGAFDLVDDVVSGGGAKYSDGEQFMSPGDGLSLAVDPAKLAQYADPEPSS
jgi:L-alanine-DL-glutamate epimerase-like enolase superfamily enzyme